jgi:hypothetical protein
MRCGYTVQHIPCPVTGRGDCFIARPTNDFRMGDPIAIELHGEPSGWYPPEGTHRWSSFHARLPVQDHASRVELDMVNFLTVPRTVTLTSGAHRSSVTLASGERKTATVAVDGTRVDLTTDRKLAAGVGQLLHNFRRVDKRDLGIAVERVRFL